jgi:hypothetical protein
MSAPEFDGLPMTKREVLIARHAYAKAWLACGGGCADGERAAASVYALPKATRPRVVQDPDTDYGQKWRVVDGVIEHDGGSGGARFRPAFDHEFGIQPSFCSWPTPQRIALWADLLASPTEEYEP